jgi:hypothetical protein
MKILHIQLPSQQAQESCLDLINHYGKRHLLTLGNDCMGQFYEMPWQESCMSFAAMVVDILKFTSCTVQTRLEITE